MIAIVDEFSFDQMVNKPTRKKNILDLFLTINSSLIQQSIVAPGVSDHDEIPIIDMATRPKINKPKPMENLTVPQDQLRQPYE